jgi:mRNA deadenylase 3'-5' endonuclease subunit Ccr4
LDWSYRKDAILAEITDVALDVICLQVSAETTLFARNSLDGG